MNAALGGAKPVVVVRSNGTGSLKVTVPRGDITRNVVKNRQFAFVSGYEKQRVSEVVMKAFSDIVIPGVQSGIIGEKFEKQHISRVLQDSGQRDAK
jgi:dephospho-CoA kinase